MDAKLQSKYLATVATEEIPSLGEPPKNHVMTTDMAKTACNVVVTLARQGRMFFHQQPASSDAFCVSGTDPSYHVVILCEGCRKAHFS